MRLAPSLAPEPDRFAIRADACVPQRGQRSRRGAAPVLQPRRRWAGAVVGLRAATASTLIIGVLAALAREEARAPVPLAASSPAPSAPQPAWRPAADLAPLYALDETRFAVRLHPELGREDAVVVGALGEAGPHLRLVLRRGPALRPSSFFLDLARRAGEVGLSVARSGRAEAVPTRFGPAEAAEAVLVGAVGRTCLAFRFEGREVGWSAAGWLCGPTGRPATGERLACLLDRLTLAPTATIRRWRPSSREKRGLLAATCEAPRAAAEHPASERIPAELFLEGTPAEPAARPPRLGRSQRRERS